MAGSWILVANTSQPIVLSATSVIPGETIAFKTAPTGIVLEYPVPRSTWPDAGGKEIITTIANGVEQMISEGFAVGGSYVQTFDDNELLVDYCDFLVRWRDPTGFREEVETTARVPLSLFAGAGDPFAFGLIADAEAILQKAYDNLARLAAA